MRRLLFVIALASVACGSEPTPSVEAKTRAPASSSETTQPADPQVALAREGAGIYNSTCIACHNRDPKEAGSLGPAIAGSSMALLEAKVVHNTYPPGYEPKRETKAMIPLAYLEPKIPAIHAFLNR